MDNESETNLVDAAAVLGVVIWLIVGTLHAVLNSAVFAVMLLEHDKSTHTTLPVDVNVFADTSMQWI